MNAVRRTAGSPLADAAVKCDREAMAELSRDVGSDLDDGTFDLAGAMAERAAAHRAGWTQWARTATDGGAAAAHRWTKLPSLWRPVAAKRRDGTITADPLATLEQHRRHFG